MCVAVKIEFYEQGMVKMKGHLCIFTLIQRYRGVIRTKLQRNMSETVTASCSNQSYLHSSHVIHMICKIF
jgi:hypothetical protein